MDGDKRFTICRLCLSGSDNLIHVFEDKGMHRHTPAVVIQELLRHEVNEWDIYPQCVCAECMRKLEDFKLFKDQCERCRNLLDRAYAGKRVSSSSEEAHNHSRSDHDDSGALPLEVVSAEIPTVEPKSEPDEDIDCKPIIDDMGRVVEDPSLNERNVHSRDKHDQGLASIGAPQGVTPDIPLLQPKVEPVEERNWDEVVDDAGMVAEEDSANTSGVHVWIDCDRKEVHNDAVEMITPDTPLIEPKTEAGMSDCYKPTFGIGVRGEENVAKETSAGVKGNINDPPGSSYSIQRDSEHPGEIFQCTICGKSFQSPMAYRCHIYEHKRGKKFQCNECGRYLSSKSVMQQHMKRHSGPKVECNICGKIFKDKLVLKSHLVTHGVYKFTCGQCGEVFSEIADLEDHKSTHSGVIEHRCEICGVLCDSISQLQRHKCQQKSSPLNKHPCSICDKSFRAPSHLKIHMQGHTGEKPFECPECKMCFNRKGNLQKHMKKHDTSTSLHCDQCGLQYANQHSLDRHKKNIHLGLKEFQCHECGKEFTQRDSLKRHVLRKHRKD